MYQLIIINSFSAPIYYDTKEQAEAYRKEMRSYGMKVKITKKSTR